MSQKVRCYLRTLRRGWGLTQEEVAALLPKATRKRVSRVERELSAPNAEEIIAYGLIFGLPPSKAFPRFQAKVEEAVMQRAYRLHKRLEGDDSQAARRKREFMEKMLARATGHAKRNGI